MGDGRSCEGDAIAARERGVGRSWERNWWGQTSGGEAKKWEEDKAGGESEGLAVYPCMRVFPFSIYLFLLQVRHWAATTLAK
jgi:hypothetical protein